MKILYFGMLCDDYVFTEIEKKKKPYFIAQFMYEKAIVEELERYEKITMDKISLFQTYYFPKDNFIINKNSHKSDYDYISYVNIPFVREVCCFLSTLFMILKFKIKNKRNQDLVIFASNHYPPVSLAIVLSGWILKIPKIITFTDLSLFTYSKERISKMKFYKKIIIKPYLKIVNFLQVNYDGYVLFSERMRDIVNPEGKPQCVVEGTFNSDSLDLTTIKKSGENIIAHAGTLNKEVGISKILEVFKNINLPDAQLWLIGQGDMSKEIEESTKTDPRIKHFGFLPKKEVFTLLKKANVLVNFRNKDDEYTKYSFPSKMFEYMASGTPVITTKIKGIPEEYYKYVYSVDSNDESELRKIVENVLIKSEVEIEKKGSNAREFIIQHKNPKVQVNKIVSLIDCVLNDKHM